MSTDADYIVIGAGLAGCIAASVMPAVTSANTNAPSMMIGYRVADFIEKEAI